MQEYFTTFGTLADVYIPKPPRGFAFVTFEKGDVAEAVLGVSSGEISQLTLSILIRNVNFGEGFKFLNFDHF